MSSPNGSARGRHYYAIVIGSGHNGLVGADDFAPPGRHTLSLDVHYAPNALADETWDGRRDAIVANIVDAFAENAPNQPGAIEHVHVLEPLDHA